MNTIVKIIYKQIQVYQGEITYTWKMWWHISITITKPLLLDYFSNFDITKVYVHAVDYMANINRHKHTS